MSETRTRQVAAEKDLAAYQQVAAVAKVFADPVRLEIIEALAQGARNVDSLAQVCGLPLKNISHHLRTLRKKGFVDRVKLGRRAVYSLADESIASFWAAFRRFAEQRVALAEVDLKDWQQSDQGISAESLAPLLAQQRVLVVDVRPAEEFASGHLPGALSLPESELEHRLMDLPRGRPVIAFCRGPYCRLADRAVSILKKAGFEALRCADGVVEWRAAGMSLKVE